MGFKINEYNSTLNKKLQRGLKIIGEEKGLSQNENKEFILENKFKSSFIYCNSENYFTITNTETNATEKQHSCECNNKFCVTCESKKNFALCNLTLATLSKNKESYYFFPATWTFKNIKANQIREQTGRIKKFISNKVKKRKGFNNYIKDHIFKFEYTESSDLSINLHIHSLFAIPIDFYNICESEIVELLNDIEKKWEYETGGYICVDDRYSGSEWNCPKTFEEVRKWILYLYSPFWIAKGKTRYSSRKKQHVKNKEECMEDIMAVSDKGLAYFVLELANQPLMIKGGLFSHESNRKKQEKRKYENPQEFTAYERSMIYNKYSYSEKDSQVSSEGYCETLNENLHQRRYKFMKNLFLKIGDVSQYIPHKDEALDSTESEQDSKNSLNKIKCCDTNIAINEQKDETLSSTKSEQNSESSLNRIKQLENFVETMLVAYRTDKKRELNLTFFKKLKRSINKNKLPPKIVEFYMKESILRHEAEYNKFLNEQAQRYKRYICIKSKKGSKHYRMCVITPSHLRLEKLLGIANEDFIS